MLTDTMSGRQDNRNPGLIPSRWLHCPRKASDLVANKFLAFKTPLSAQYDDQVPEEHRFLPSMIFQSMKSYKVWCQFTGAMSWRANTNGQKCLSVSSMLVIM